MQLGPDTVERRTFGIERRGFDRDEVRSYLHEVAVAMARLEGEARGAEVEVDRLQREVQQLTSLSTGGFRESAARLALAAAPAVAPRTIETDAARRALAAAELEAARLKARAESLVEDALATTEQIAANQVRLIDTAKANRTLLLNEAQIEADDIIAKARAAAAATRTDAQRFAEELRELTAAETIELVSYAKAMAASILEAAGGSLSRSEDVTIDLREDEPEETQRVEWSTETDTG
jgi:cell division septum initiation protein DivIVA